jgi:hypothetical protein
MTKMLSTLVVVAVGLMFVNSALATHAPPGTKLLGYEASNFPSRILQYDIGNDMFETSYVPPESQNGRGIAFDQSGGGFLWYTFVTSAPTFLGDGLIHKTSLPPAARTWGRSHSATVRAASIRTISGRWISTPTTAISGRRVTTSGRPEPTTNDQGVATVCFTGPDLPGKDVIEAFADTDEDGVQDAPPPLGDEPFDIADKAWVLPVSTPLCEVKIDNGGWIYAMNGDRSSFGGIAKADAAGDASGNEEYQDHGPSFQMNLHGNVLAILRDSDTEATIYGRATVDGGPVPFFYRIRVQDNGEGGTAVDVYGIIVANGYASGDQPLQGGTSRSITASRTTPTRRTARSRGRFIVRPRSA